MTKLEILAIRGVRDNIKLRMATPKPDWLSDEVPRGKREAYETAQKLLGELLDAATAESG